MNPLLLTQSPRQCEPTHQRRLNPTTRRFANPVPEKRSANAPLQIRRLARHAAPPHYVFDFDPPKDLSQRTTKLYTQG
jgi:hypothetical protein